MINWRKLNTNKVIHRKWMNNTKQQLTVAVEHGILVNIAFFLWCRDKIGR